MKANKKIKISIVLLVICVFIAAIPLFVFKNSEFTGSDDAGAEAISEINPNYKVWAKPILEFEEKNTELLFILQAALGTLGVGYCFVKLRKRNLKNRR